MDFSATEIMTVAASRALNNQDVCFVGIGLPSAACNLARLTHAPDITLIYESGTIGTRPNTLPLSIGDHELSETACTTVPVVEMFRYWLQGGRITKGFLGGAQLDAYGNINSTVIGNYQEPKVRLPGGGGAPEIATACGEVFVVMRQSKRGFVSKLDFVTSLGHGAGRGSRRALGVSTKGPTRVITDLCVMEPDEYSQKLQVTSLHPGVSMGEVEAKTGWTVEFASTNETAPPTQAELDTLRDLIQRTELAHGR